MSRFEVNQVKGVVPTTMTFFNREKNVDIECTRHMVELMLEHGANGFYFTGGIGECFTMTVEERNLVVDTVIGQMKDRVPVVVHVGDIDTKESIEFAKHTYRAGTDAVSSIPPLYWKFRVGDIYNYYRGISESTPLPVVVYNIQLAGLMDTDLLSQLAGLPDVYGLKYAAKSHDKMGFIEEILGPDFMIYLGCGEMTLSGICSGTDGIIRSFYNLFPDLYKQVLKKMKGSGIRGGTRLQRIVGRVTFAALRYDPPSVLHSLMNWRGLESGYSRRPFYNYQDSELEGLKEDIRGIRDRYQAEKLDMFRL